MTATDMQSIIREAIEAGRGKLANYPRRWFALYGVVYTKDCHGMAGLKEFQIIKAEMVKKLKSKQVRAESCRW